MKVNIEKTFQVGQPVEKVWELLRDPHRVAPCVPGAQITEDIDENRYKGTISVKLGPVTTKYQGELKVERRDDTTHELEMAGTGTDAKGQGSASMKMIAKLTPLDGGGTKMSSSMEVSVVGRVAQFGARMMQDISNQMFEQFTDCFERRLHDSAGSEAGDRSAPSEVDDRTAPAAGAPASGTTATGAPAANVAAATAAEVGTAAAGTPGAPTGAAGPKAQPTPAPRREPTPEPEPIKAVPLLLHAVRNTIVRLFRRLTGGTSES